MEPACHSLQSTDSLAGVAYQNCGPPGLHLRANKRRRLASHTSERHHPDQAVPTRKILMALRLWHQSSTQYFIDQFLPRFAAYLRDRHDNVPRRRLDSLNVVSLLRDYVRLNAKGKCPPVTCYATRLRFGRRQSRWRHRWALGVHVLFHGISVYTQLPGDPTHGQSLALRLLHRFPPGRL